MSRTRGVLAQFPESEAHDKVLDNNPDRIGIWKCWFLTARSFFHDGPTQKKTLPDFHSIFHCHYRCKKVSGLYLFNFDCKEGCDEFIKCYGSRRFVSVTNTVDHFTVVAE